MTTKTAPAKRWRVRPQPEAVPQGEWPPLIGRLLANRGLVDAAEARAFIDGMSPPVALPDIEKAVGRLAGACKRGETVAVFGDFDVDGVTAAALLTESLSALGAKPLPYLPHRANEGYGLNVAAIASLAGLGATLLVTADCGTSNVAEIADAAMRGMDIIVLDHHTVPPLLPAAGAIVNPKRDPNSKDEPAACGIAYHVLVALHDALGCEFDDAAMLELAALGTVCDLAPLRGENRRIVRDGLRALAKTQRPGLRALLASAGLDPQRIDTEAVGYTIGPRLNAAGRMAHARLAFDLLTTRDDARGEELAGELGALNRERQQATEQAMALAGELFADEDAPLIMLGHAELPAGIIGLVAARLAEAYYRPAVVYEQGDETSRASARSIAEFDLAGALRSCPELFERFGGHRAAAGFTARNERLPEIKAALQAHAGERLTGIELAPAIEIDAEVPLSWIRGEEIRWLGRLAPHGVGNPEPTFLSRNVQVVERRAVGADGDHLRLKLRDGPVAWPAIAFRHDGDGIEEGAPCDVVFTMSADRLTSDGLQLRVLDVRPAGQ
jgi:single-stranded-DNA-specific exonuclease